MTDKAVALDTHFSTVQMLVLVLEQVKEMSKPFEELGSQHHMNTARGLLINGLNKRSQLNGLCYFRLCELVFFLFFYFVM